MAKARKRVLLAPQSAGDTGILRSFYFVVNFSVKAKALYAQALHSGQRGLKLLAKRAQ